MLVAEIAVELGARGVHTDSLFDRLEALLLYDLRHREHLGDRLDRHFGSDVACRMDLAGHERDAE
jgi:hypothetical protein